MNGVNSVIRFAFVNHADPSWVWLAHSLSHWEALVTRTQGEENNKDGQKNTIKTFQS